MPFPWVNRPRIYFTGLFTDVSGQPVGAIFMGKSSKNIFDWTVYGRFGTTYRCHFHGSIVQEYT